MTDIQRFVLAADHLAVQVQENGNRVNKIRNRLEIHDRVSRFRVIARFAEKAARIFTSRIEERKNGNGY